MQSKAFGSGIPEAVAPESSILMRVMVFDGVGACELSKKNSRDKQEAKASRR